MEPEPRRVARVIDALRRGWPVRIGALTFLSIEYADPLDIDAFDPADASAIVISHARARTLGLANQREAAEPETPVALARAEWHDVPALKAIADPTLDLARPVKGPFIAVDVQDRASAAAALEVARLGNLLPALLMRDEHGPFEACAHIDDVAAYLSTESIRIVARARLPVAKSEEGEVVAFRARGSRDEHVALIVGSPGASVPLVRLHSECLTGDVFGSLKCDCGPQLQAALTRIASSGWGILLYLRQEGRGIGLINKLRAYALQDQGYDTVDANLRLGFAIDSRDFGVAARMLDLLGASRIRLMTNNPDKVAALVAAGIDVTERVPHSLPANPHNARYLATKRDRTGHQL